MASKIVPQLSLCLIIDIRLSVSCKLTLTNSGIRFRAKLPLNLIRLQSIVGSNCGMTRSLDYYHLILLRYLALHCTPFYLLLSGVV